MLSLIQYLPFTLCVQGLAQTLPWVTSPLALKKTGEGPFSVNRFQGLPSLPQD